MEIPAGPPITNTATFVFKFDRLYIEEDGTPRIVMIMNFEGKDYPEHHIAPGEEYTLNFDYAVAKGRPHGTSNQERE